MFSFLFHLVLCVNTEDYLFGQHSEFGADNNNYFFYKNSVVRPGQKLHMNPSSGGASKAIKFTAKSESQAKAFFGEKLSKKDYDSVKKKLKYPKFRIQLCTMTTNEVFIDRPKPINPQYQGRYFEIKTHFISCKKDGNNYNIVYAPFTVSLMAKTFLWHKNPSPKRWYTQYEVTYQDVIDFSSPKTIADNVMSYIESGTLVTDSHIRVSFSASSIEKIFSRLHPFIEPEKQKFNMLSSY